MSGALIIVGADPARVSELLGVQPDRFWKAGERKSFILPDGSRTELSSFYEQPGWTKFSPDHAVEPVAVVRYWVEFVGLRKKSFAQLDPEASARVEVLCQENQLIELDAEELRVLSSARVGLGITVQVID